VSPGAQKIVAVVWIASALVVGIDGHLDIDGRPWMPALIAYALGAGGLSTLLVVAVDRYLRRRHTERSR